MDRLSDDAGQGQHLSEALLSFAQYRQFQPARIARLRQENDVFREICADYEECCAQLLNLENTSTAGGQLRDYSEMRDQLEGELERHLKDADTTGGTGKTGDPAKSD